MNLVKEYEHAWGKKKIKANKKHIITTIYVLRAWNEI